MYLSRHLTARGARWALDGYLPAAFTLISLAESPAGDILIFLEACPAARRPKILSCRPSSSAQEVWASGVTYERSRKPECSNRKRPTSTTRSMMPRPELLQGYRLAGQGHEGAVRVREDSHWNVPEPELVLVLNDRMEILGYTAGNDVSSRDIEGENSLSAAGQDLRRQLLLSAR